MQWSRLGTSIAPAAAMLCKVNISERDAVCGRFKLNKMPQKGTRPLQRLWRTGCCVHAIRTLTRPSWTLCSDGKSARMTHNVPTPRPADNETHATPSPAVVSAAQLVKLQGEQQCETWLLPSGRPVLVGRSGNKSSSLDVNLWPDMSVSRRHALIWFDGEGWYIEDLQSTNGTVLGDSNIRGQHAIRLAPGTKIQFGCTVLMLTALAPESGESAQASADVPSAD